MAAHHGREDYFVVGEGLLGVTAPSVPGAVASASLAEPDLRAFRFSRLGPKGRAMPERLRRRLAAAMTMDVDAGGPTLRSAVPAGYTYLGQFLDHDLTFDRSRLREDAVVPVADLVQGRSPSLDLDSLYGLGPGLTPAFHASGGRLRIGATRRSDFRTPGVDDGPRAGFDLPRRPDGSPLIPDPRNDENLAVAQTHLHFIRFHNRVVAMLAADGVPPGERYGRAREIVVRHYQWMIRTDFLPRIVKPQLVDDVFTRGRRVFETAPPPGAAPTMPVEFSVAAYRLGHSMVRTAYDWNRVFEDGAGSLSLLFGFTGGGGLGGGPRLPTNWIADMRRLYDFREAGRPDLRPMVGGRSRLNMARRIDTLLANPLADLPAGSTGGPEGVAVRRNLAFRNLTRARMLQLATGQQMLALMRSRGVTVSGLDADRIIRGNRGADLSGLDAAQRRLLGRETPLWFYVLREAEFNGGRMAGVGGRIVAETFHRAIEGSTISILADPAWRPTLGPDPDTFRMVDLLLVAAEGREELLNPLGG
ncbi:peroxidase family protein [Miltoncostaea oceani]|uniref:peroxidase family protein n=1 Tax=Miltoncostaea oceani TaxID=2843216 RepID=UPI001C3D985F|nr:heme peroxidase family protein [Miltoncostaea oceani]